MKLHQNGPVNTAYNIPWPLIHSTNSLMSFSQTKECPKPIVKFITARNNLISVTNILFDCFSFCIARIWEKQCNRRFTLVHIWGYIVHQSGYWLVYKVTHQIDSGVRKEREKRILMLISCFPFYSVRNMNSWYCTSTVSMGFYPQNYLEVPQWYISYVL